MPPGWIQLPATCRAVGEHCYVFVADEEWQITMDEADVQEVFNYLEFETMNSIPAKDSNYSDDKKVKTGISNVNRRLKILFDNRFKFNIDERRGKFHTSLIIDL
jgi:sensor histidine kinase YesM